MIFLFPKVGYVNPLEGMYLQCPVLPFHHWDCDPKTAAGAWSEGHRKHPPKHLWRGRVKRIERAAVKTVIKSIIVHNLVLVLADWFSTWGRFGDLHEFAPFSASQDIRNHQQSWEIMNYAAKLPFIPSQNASNMARAKITLTQSSHKYHGTMAHISNHWTILDQIGPLSFMLSPGPAAPDLETDTEVGWSWRMLREDEFWGMPSFCCWY